ncbi:MAG: hypothetical protein H8E55_49500 [Pelagibacterales bacterium]|nr:hypothetical protein [Pelagibacterales bacterium]
MNNKPFKHTTTTKLNELIREIILSPDNAVEIQKIGWKAGSFIIGDIEYTYIFELMKNPYPNELGMFYNVGFTEQTDAEVDPNIPTGNAKEKYIKILSTMYKVILDFVEREEPDYLGLVALDKAGYWNIYNQLTKHNDIPGYYRKDPALNLSTKSNGKGKIIVLKRKTLHE